MNQKGVVIVIPGAHSLISYPSWIQNFILTIGRKINVHPAKEDHAVAWRNKIESQSSIIWMKWARQIDALSLWLAKRKLSKLLKHYKNQTVTLVGISLSGKIILDLLRKEFYQNVSKIVLVCSINDLTKINFKHPKIFNLYSEKDDLAKLAIEVYSPFHGGQKLYGENIENILIPDLNHNDFCKNSVIKKGKFKGQTITQVINNLL